MRDLESLIEDIYVAAHRPEYWPMVLRGISAETGSRDCVFQSLRITADGITLVGGMAGEIDDALMAAYARTVDEIGDPRVQHAFQQPLARVNQDPDFISKAAMRRHPYYEDWLRPLGFRYGAIVLGSIERTWDQHIVTGIGLQRSARQGPVTGDALGRFEELVPHVVRAIRVAGRVRPDLAPSPDKGDATEACFGLDERGVLRAMNEAAQGWLAGTRLRIGADGRLQFSEPLLRDAVDTALRAALVRDPTVPLGGRIRLAGDVVSFVVVVVPRSPSLRDAATVSDVAIELRVSATSAEPRLMILLTPAQDRIVRRLAEGQGLRDTAAEFGITYETVRAHLKQAMLKWGVHSQAALVAKWLLLQAKTQS